MSFKLIGKAFDIPLKANDKLVFLSLCEYAHDDDNSCYPSIQTLMKKASISKGGLSYCLNVLENLGFIKRESRKRDNGSNKSTLYTVYVDVILDEKLYANRKDLIKLHSSDNEQGGTVHSVNYPSSDNEQGVNSEKSVSNNGYTDISDTSDEKNHSSDNEHLEPLDSFNPYSNPKNTKKTSTNFKVLLEKLRENIKAKSKVKYSTVAEKEYLDCKHSDEEIIDIYTRYIKTLKSENYMKKLEDFFLDIEQIIEDLNKSKEVRGYGQAEIGSIQWQREQEALKADAVDAEVIDE